MLRQTRFFCLSFFLAYAGFATELKIELKHNPDSSWQLTYRLPESVPGLAFQRRSNFRQANWQMVSPNITLTAVGGREVLLAEPNQTFRTVILRFDTYSKNLPKDYEFFQEFTDGGVIVYSGHLSVEPVTVLRGKGYAKDQLKAYSKTLKQTYSFLPQTQEHLVVQGTQYNAGAHDLSIEGDGTYAYFGSAVPVQSRGIIAIVDPGLPAWLRRETTSFLPRLFDFYARKTGFELSQRPMVFFGFDPTSQVGLNYSGGTLPGLIQLTVSGADWQRKRPEHLELLTEFLAHEAAHLWNGQMFLNQDQQMGASWIHEGGADAFAYRALLELGVMSVERFNERLSWALNRCAQGLRGKSLKSHQDGAEIQNAYVCGSTVSLITEAAVRRAKSGDDVFDFWHALFLASEQSERRYSQAMYFQVLKKLSGNDLTLRVLREFVTRPQTQPLEVLVEQLRVLGVSVRASSELPDEQQRFLSFDAMRRLASHDCNGRHSVSYQKDHLRVGGGADCRSFKQSFYAVTEVGSNNVYRSGGRAYDYIQNRCENQRSVLMQSSNKGRLSVACTLRFPKREEWMGVSGYSL